MVYLYLRCCHELEKVNQRRTIPISTKIQKLPRRVREFFFIESGVRSQEAVTDKLAYFHLCQTRP
ncbi:MAG: hypothetical protein RLZZ507_4382 [Cyanobacteriota bacterium]|jgi:hypothetical protein